MKKFEFKLKGLLGLQEWEEQIARQSLNRAIQRVTQLEEKAQSADQAREAICDRWNESRAESFSRNERLAMQGSIETAGREADEARASLKVLLMLEIRR